MFGQISRCFVLIPFKFHKTNMRESRSNINKLAELVPPPRLNLVCDRGILASSNRCDSPAVRAAVPKWALPNRA